jgi:hypothetical protein
VTDSNMRRVAKAVHNNAVWCDTVCHAHGLSGEFTPDIWLRNGPVPRYYPNAVTLTAETGITAQMAAIQTLTGSSVKDSYQTLDLAPLGFNPLFDATWIWLEADSRKHLDATTSGEYPEDYTVLTVKHPVELARWEQAWADSSTEIVPEDRIFPASLLEDSTVHFIAAYRDNQIVAGVIANQTGDVVGLSNQFAPPSTPKFHTKTYWAGCIVMIQFMLPGLPIVGYEHGDSLTLANALGFDQIGPLRVWVR